MEQLLVVTVWSAWWWHDWLTGSFIAFRSFFEVVIILGTPLIFIVEGSGCHMVPWFIGLIWIDLKGKILQETSVFSPLIYRAFHELALQAFLRMILVGLYISTNSIYISFNHLPTWWPEVMAMRSLIRIWTVMTGTAFREGTAWVTWWQCPIPAETGLQHGWKWGRPW